MGGLCKHTPLLQNEAKLPCGPCLLALRLVDDYRIKQTHSSDLLDKRRLDRPDAVTEHLAKLFSAIGKILLDKNFQSRCCNGTTQWVPSKSWSIEDTKDVGQ